MNEISATGNINVFFLSYKHSYNYLIYINWNQIRTGFIGINKSFEIVYLVIIKNQHIVIIMNLYCLKKI